MLAGLSHRQLDPQAIGILREGQRAFVPQKSDAAGTECAWVSFGKGLDECFAFFRPASQSTPCCERPSRPEKPDRLAVSGRQRCKNQPIPDHAGRWERGCYRE